MRCKTVSDIKLFTVENYGSNTGFVVPRTSLNKMEVLVLFLSAIVAVSVEGATPKIVGGEDAVYGQHPYICSLQLRNWVGGYSHSCGAVIWNREYLVTAAHCLGSSASQYRVVCGINRLNAYDTYRVQANVRQYHMHPMYNGNANGFPNDIALLHLSSALTFTSHVDKATFANSGSNFLGQSCKLTGWGRLSGGGSTPDTLQKVNLTKIANGVCNSMWNAAGVGNAINDGHICFYTTNGMSACNGDSGGPVRCGRTLAGVTSWGDSWCSGSKPSVYTRVSYFYSWLNSIAGPNN